MTPRPTLQILAAALLAVGFIGAGWLAGRGMQQLRTGDRYVTVKGSAEKDVDADLVVWPLAHFTSGNDLAEVQRGLEANTQAIRAFFNGAGFTDDEIVVAPASLEDRWSYAYGDNRPPER